MKFEDGEGITGKDYGIQCYGENLMNIIRVIINASKYTALPLRSHHGISFNFASLNNITLSLAKRDGYMLFIFKTKNWKTELLSNKEHFWVRNLESCFSLKEKRALLKMFQLLGYSIKEKWNHDNKCPSVSIVINQKADFQTEEYFEECRKKFLEVLNDFGGIER